ncbi:hypothetical protein TWF481_009338 [Arthrobotrys musiformis]|uniref:F-box domain-containing protein n=1 Tax=Arthrobotrys musiformis TaxID=47236 RepID=A0AAV9W580_9PEZI
MKYQAEMENPIDVDFQSERQESIASESSNPFLSLPVEILLEVTKQIAYRDLIALSLTTKGLRYLCPKRPEDKRELRCFFRIHRKFLSDEYIPQSQHKSRTRKPQIIPPANCPYCQHRLCPPTCETALFLDSDSGFFFPRHLFPTHIAKFRYGGKYTDHIKGLDNSFPSQKRGGQIYYYSTIWCEHHRCPRDMLSKKKYYKPKSGLGVPLFLKEYHHWRQTKLVSHEVGIGHWVHDRWKVGYRLPPGVKDATDVDEDDLIPIHEKFFYDSMCLHCLSELPFYSNGPYWRQAQFLAYYCSCHKDAKLSKETPEQRRVRIGPRVRRTCCIRVRPPVVEHRGCQSCGYVSVKFTRIEAFDYVRKKEDGTGIENGRNEGYWAYLATEHRLSRSPAGYRGDERQRLCSVRPEEDAKLLDIVRGSGYGLIPLNAPRVGIQDLPYKILRQILEYLSHEATGGPERDMSSFPLGASYCFIKAWFGREAQGNITQNIAEPYYVKVAGSLERDNFHLTELYIKGQTDHKVRRLTQEAHEAHRGSCD